VVNAGPSERGDSAVGSRGGRYRLAPVPATERRTGPRHLHASPLPEGWQDAMSGRDGGLMDAARRFGTNDIEAFASPRHAGRWHRENFRRSGKHRLPNDASADGPGEQRNLPASAWHVSNLSAFVLPTRFLSALTAHYPRPDRCYDDRSQHDRCDKPRQSAVRRGTATVERLPIVPGRHFRKGAASVSNRVECRWNSGRHRDARRGGIPANAAVLYLSSAFAGASAHM